MEWLVRQAPFRPQLGKGTLRSAAFSSVSLLTRRMKFHFVADCNPQGGSSQPRLKRRPRRAGDHRATPADEAERRHLLRPPGASAPSPAAARSCRRAARGGAGRAPLPHGSGGAGSGR